FVIDFFGGAALGAVGAWIATLSFKLLRQRPLAEVTITIALPYILYIVAEDYIHSSGVMAVVVAALVIGARGRTNVTPQTWSILMTVWDQIVFLASAMVFIFVAMMVPRILLQIYWSDVIALVILIAAAFAARAVSLYGLLPLLGFAGLAEQVSGKFKLVMLWGGLRGAVTLVLALAIIDNSIVPDDISRFIGVLAMSFVMFTLLVNGTSLRLIMRLLRLDRLSNIDRALRDRTIGLALSAVADRTMELAERYRMEGPSTDEIIESYHSRRTRAIERRENQILDPEEEFRLGLMVLAAREEELYLRHFDQSTVSRHTAVDLVAKAGRMRDAAKSQGSDGYLKAALGSVRERTSFRSAMWLQARLGIGAFLERRLADRFENTTITRIVLGEQLDFTESKLMPLMGRAVCLRLKDVLVERLDTVNTALEALRRQFPDYAERLQTRFLIQAALRLEEREYDMLRQEGVLNSEILSNLKRNLSKRWAGVAARPSLDLGLDTESLVRGFPMFEGLPDDQILEIKSFLSPRLAVPGERLMSAGERGDFMLFISSGVIEVAVGEEHFSLGRGDFVGEMAILSGLRRRADVTAMSYCQLLVLPGRDFRRFAKANPVVRQRIRDTADERSARLDEADPKLKNQA
ncbi:MAG: cation:proton antiporter, partial [Pseudomonadota bacterium]